MRVCVVSPYSWAFPNGVPKHASSLAEHLERRGHEVCVLSPDDPPDRVSRILHPRLGKGRSLPNGIFPVGRTISVPSNGTLIGIAFSPRVFYAVWRVMRRLRPDVVHVHEPLVPLSGWAAVLAARRLGIPVVGTFHAHYPGGCVHYRIFKSILEPLYRALDVRLAVSPMAAKTVTGHFPGKVRIIPNGVDAERFDPGPEAAPRTPHEVLFVGRSAPRKGLPVLLDAFEGVLKKIPEARLVVVGSHPEEVELPKRLLSSVEVRGIVGEDELVAAMRSASVLCAPSVGAESFGMVLLEAMAAGLPVLASDIPGYDAVVAHDRDGLLFPPGDSGALADALVGLLGDRGLRERLSDAAFSTARRYDWPRVAAEVEGIYAAVGNGAPFEG